MWQALEGDTPARGEGISVLGVDPKSAARRRGATKRRRAVPANCFLDRQFPPERRLLGDARDFAKRLAQDRPHSDRAHRHSSGSIRRRLGQRSRRGGFRWAALYVGRPRGRPRPKWSPPARRLLAVRMGVTNAPVPPRGPNLSKRCRGHSAKFERRALPRQRSHRGDESSGIENVSR